MTTTSLHGLKGQVLRLRGVVDRFGGFEYQGKVWHTVCVRNLELARSGEPLQPDHWWFRLRQPWSEAGVQAGDTILFTAKVEFPRFQGQVDRGHAMTTRLSIDDQPHQDPAPVHGAAEAGGH